MVRDPPAPSVRPARPADEPALRRLQRHLAEPSPELLSYALSTGDALVSTADDAGVPVGYLLAVVGDAAALGGGPARRAGANGTGGDSRIDYPGGGTHRGSGDRTRTGGAHVAELVVAPARRRQGRASALLAALFERLAPGERATVAVAPDNGPALSLYERWGFERIARREGYFESGAALLLARAVPGEDGNGSGDDAGPA